MKDFLIGYVMGHHTMTGAKIARHQDEAQEMAERVERLVLVVDAMWQLLEGRGHSQEALFALIRERDPETHDPIGPHPPRSSRCTKCQSLVEPGRDRCSICGARLQPR